MGKCQKLTGSPRSVNFGAKNWEEFNFEWVELGDRLKPDLETNPSGMHASPSPGRHLSTPQVELFPWNPLNRGEGPVSFTQGCSHHHRRATRIPDQWDGSPGRAGSPSPHSRLPIRRGRTLPYCLCAMEAFRLRGHPQSHACAGRACVEISAAGWRHGQSRARLADPRLQPASPASQLAASVRPSVRQQRYPTRLSQAPARDRGPR